MTDRQRRFAEAFAACGNAAQAAREAGYSERTARSQGQRLLTNVDILKYIRELQDQAAAGRIASMLQVQAFWSDVLNDPAEKQRIGCELVNFSQRRRGRSSMSGQGQTMMWGGWPWERLTARMW